MTYTEKCFLNLFKLNQSVIKIKIWFSLTIFRNVFSSVNMITFKSFRTFWKNKLMFGSKSNVKYSTQPFY